MAIFLKRKENELKNKIYPNVFVDEINFGGKTITDLNKYLEEKEQKIKNLIIIFKFNEEIASFSGKQVNLSLDREIIKKQTFHIGRSPFFFSRIYQQISAIFGVKKFYFYSTLSYDLEPITNYLQYLERKYNNEPVDALFRLENFRVVSFRMEKEGKRVLTKKAINELLTWLKPINLKNRQKIEIVVKEEIIKPKITLASVNNLGIVEKISEGKSDFSGSLPERIHNIKIALAKFHGVLIPKNEIFSFNKTLGEVSFETGYKKAYIIKNGRTILGDGGGICQVSTTLFRAALNAGLEIVERHPHAYRVSYYENDGPPGFDATVFAPEVDLKFKNNTPAHILIQGAIDENQNLLVFTFYGKKDNRQIEISPPSIFDIQPPLPPIYQEDPNLKKGITKQVDWPAWGAKVKFHYKVINEGKIIIDQDFFSFYKPWPAVYLVGTAE